MLEEHAIDEVRELVDRLIEKGYDQHAPTATGDRELLRSWEASMAIVSAMDEMKGAVDEALQLVRSRAASIRGVFDHFGQTIVPYLCAVPMKGGGAEELPALLRNLGDSYCRGRDPDDEEDAMFGIDSDEEARLFEELDQLVDVQERMETFRTDSRRFMANSFQKSFLHILDLEDAFELVL